ncbi:hypothetical protein KSP39_PZI023240 [Platanthera zijinensis]|uniref:C2H2-type domain-containing protein n=1 Tax=Platanthera zijinensis TaxID=2320716 RepID=A0AAP0AWA4_9ASPA
MPQSGQQWPPLPTFLSPLSAKKLDRADFRATPLLSLQSLYTSFIARFPSWMETTNYAVYERRPAISRERAPTARWFKKWVPQDLASTGGNCSLLKWVNEDMLDILEEKKKEMEKQQAEPDPTTEVLFLCSYEGCGKFFVDVGALKKHAHIHGERQYVCHFEGCGKAFSLDFNLRAHMRTHSLENYHICPYEDCGKRYTHECKLNSHIKTHHEKNVSADSNKQAATDHKLHITPKPPAAVHTGSASSDRPYACPYEGCGKAYIHEYKLNLHLRKEHPEHNSQENGKIAIAPSTDHDMDEASDHDAHAKKAGGGGKNSKRSKSNPMQQFPPTKPAERKAPTTLVPANIFAAKIQWVPKSPLQEDSEETEEDRDDAENDDEETEDED